jgi:hypothetical protein
VRPQVKVLRPVGAAVALTEWVLRVEREGLDPARVSPQHQWRAGGHAESNSEVGFHLDEEASTSTWPR